MSHNSKSYNIAIIGYGLAAKIFHIPHIRAVPGLTVYGVVQRNPVPGNSAAEDHPGIQTWRTTEDLLKDEKVDVVVVTTTPDSHFGIAKQVLEAGKNVVVEKPFVPTENEARELVRIAKEKGKLITVYQNRRFDADFLTLRALLESNKLGRVVEFETHFDRYSPVAPSTWHGEARPGNGAIYDLGTHLIDQVVATFGLPEKITAFVRNQRVNAPAEPGDSFTVLLHYKNGLVATAKAAVVSPEEEQLRYWVRGEKGSFKKFHLDCQEDQLLAGKRPGDEGFGVEPESHHGTLTVLEDGKPVRKAHPTLPPATYVEYYRVLAKALRGEGEVPVKAEEAANVIRLVELAKQSSREGRTLDVLNS